MDKLFSEITLIDGTAIAARRSAGGVGAVVAFSYAETEMILTALECVSDSLRERGGASDATRVLDEVKDFIYATQNPAWSPDTVDDGLATN